MKKLHQNFQNDIELGLRMIKEKTELIRRYKEWSEDNIMFYELIKTINETSFTSSDPHDKVDAIIQLSIINAWNWVIPRLVARLSLPYEERQKYFVKIFNIKIGDEVVLGTLHNTLPYPFMPDYILLNATNKEMKFKIIDIVSDGIVIEEGIHTTKVPYSIIYKVDGSIIYPTPPKRRCRFTRQGKKRNSPKKR